MAQIEDWKPIDSHIRSLMRLMLPDEADVTYILEFMEHGEYGLALRFLADAVMDLDDDTSDVPDPDMEPDAFK